MNQYLPGVQPSKTCFVRLGVATKRRHLSVTLAGVGQRSLRRRTNYEELHENVFESHRHNACIRGANAIQVLNLAGVALWAPFIHRHRDQDQFAFSETVTEA